MQIETDGMWLARMALNMLMLFNSLLASHLLLHGQDCLYGIIWIAYISKVLLTQMIQIDIIVASVQWIVGKAV